jgi:small subunit ribosomal protein S3
MAHKVHPKIFRINRLENWDSRWLDTQNFKTLLKEDFEIRKFLEKKLRKIGIENIQIERFRGKLNIIIFTARPGAIVGRGGGGIDEIRKEIEKKILKDAKKELRIEIREVKNPWLSASLSAQFIAQQLEKRMPFRKVLKQTLKKITSQKEVQGVRLEVSGRLNGNEIARREYLKSGRLPRQTIRADIDYAQATAFCTYGAIGVKVWIYKGEKF